MTRLVDDIDGSQAVTTVSFALDGRSYEIDLSESHLSALQQALAPFVSAARAVPGGVRQATRIPEAKRTPAPKEQVAARQVITTETPAAPPSAPPAAAGPRAVDTLPFRQPVPQKERAAASARPKPAPLVADPFNPRS
ncbi:Lsr2 dimerization domain-containing protein [Pseudonocardia hierapolitana]